MRAGVAFLKFWIGVTKNGTKKVEEKNCSKNRQLITRNKWPETRINDGNNVEWERGGHRHQLIFLVTDAVAPYIFAVKNSKWHWNSMERRVVYHHAYLKKLHHPFTNLSFKHSYLSQCCITQSSTAYICTYCQNTFNSLSSQKSRTSWTLPYFK